MRETHVSSKCVYYSDLWIYNARVNSNTHSSYHRSAQTETILWGPFMQMVCSFFSVHMLWCVSFNSPLIIAVTWSLLMPMLFLTSQTKVVLTLSSTFSTLSSLPEICTVSGMSPDMLWGHEHIGRRTNREKWGLSFGWLWAQWAFRQMYIYKNVLYCAIIKLH